jgi:hypothetical protein
METTRMAKQTTEKTKPATRRAAVARRRVAADSGAGSPNSEPVVPPEEIGRLAHSYWEARGGEGGSAEEDWLRAEKELKARRAAK